MTGSVLRAAVPLIAGAAVAGAALAAVPRENRRAEWPVLISAMTVTALVMAAILRRRAGLPVLPGRSAVPGRGAAVVPLHLVKAA